MTTQIASLRFASIAYDLLNVADMMSDDEAIEQLLYVAKEAYVSACDADIEQDYSKLAANISAAFSALDERIGGDA